MRCTRRFSRTMLTKVERLNFDLFDSSLYSYRPCQLIDKAGAKSSLLMLGVEEEVIDARFKKFLAGDLEKTINDIENMDFFCWLELASGISQHDKKE